MAEGIRKDETPGREPMAGPGAAVDSLVEGVTGVHPSEASAQEHSAPSEGIHEAHHPSHHSYWPAVVALSLAVVGIGFLTHPVVIVMGGLLLIVAVLGWLWEPWVS